MGRCLLAVVIVGYFALVSPANAVETRVALVIGNSGYSDAPLANPANDARLIAETLRGLGFDVIERIDADLETIQLATFELQDLLFAAGKDAVGLFFYAGHGVQVRGQNYLIRHSPDNIQIRGKSYHRSSANGRGFARSTACSGSSFPACACTARSRSLNGVNSPRENHDRF